MDRVRVEIDEQRCISSMTCNAAAPWAFAYDDDEGVSRPISPVVERNAELEQAVEMCPVGAIRLLELREPQA